MVNRAEFKTRRIEKPFSDCGHGRLNVVTGLGHTGKAMTSSHLEVSTGLAFDFVYIHSTQTVGSTHVMVELALLTLSSDVDSRTTT